MKKFLIMITLIPSICFSDGLIEETKALAGIAKCLYKKTATMCLVEDIYNKNDLEKVIPSSELYGKSKNYYLKSESRNWLKVNLGNESKEDILLVESNKLGFIETKFELEQPDDIDELAKKPLMEMANNLKSNPEKIEADFWPWVYNGAIYQVCYYTNKETVECMISAAANLDEGHVTLYSLVGDAESVNESALQIIASIDVPES